MSVPVFILVDGDPHGINIMLNYRFGSVVSICNMNNNVNNNSIGIVLVSHHQDHETALKSLYIKRQFCSFSHRLTNMTVGLQ